MSIKIENLKHRVAKQLLPQGHRFCKTWQQRKPEPFSSLRLNPESRQDTISLPCCQRKLIDICSPFLSGDKWHQMMKIQYSEEWGPARMPQQGADVVLLHWAFNTVLHHLLNEHGVMVSSDSCSYFPSRSVTEGDFLPLQLKLIGSCI